MFSTDVIYDPEYHKDLDEDPNVIFDPEYLEDFDEELKLNRDDVVKAQERNTVNAKQMINFDYEGYTYKVPNPQKAKGSSGFTCSGSCCFGVYAGQHQVKVHYVNVHVLSKLDPNQYPQACELSTCAKKFKTQSERKRHYSKTSHCPVTIRKAVSKTIEPTSRSSRSGILQQQIK